MPKRSLQPELHIRCALLLAFSGGLLLAASGRQLLAGCGSRLLAGSRLIAVNRCRSRRCHRSRRSSILLLAASGRRLLAGCDSRLLAVCDSRLLAVSSRLCGRLFGHGLP